MNLPAFVRFVLASQIEVCLVGLTFLLGGMTAGFAPAMHAGWSILCLLLFAALLPRDTQ